ncbi:hypothetical protein [Fulvivirga ligni]|uniref:hypothetical protein n=1 Tax=Fulvivirga ligni TaxID=2904246 RepID=UPI001F2B482C|nr:hypothetical protein [Fulvivirga ligni]UII22609.1 hypothetical protein LVD16_05135 [Fulvivirga ligni]
MKLRIKKIKRLEKELADEKARNLGLNRMIDISDKEFRIAIRKGTCPDSKGTPARKLSLAMLPLFRGRPSN